MHIIKIANFWFIIKGSSARSFTGDSWLNGQYAVDDMTTLG